ncbi:MAG: hypothetical protein FWD75_07865 [Propionibacteriaceae bacterium]|nr:hypothetical protein [Propionibacteriaceae bacterium]
MMYPRLLLTRDLPRSNGVILALHVYFFHGPTMPVEYDPDRDHGPLFA